MVLGPEPLASDPMDAPGAPPVGSPQQIRGRSLGQIAWTRLKRDKAAVAGAVVVVFLILVAVLAPLIVKWTGNPPNEFHQGDQFLDPNSQVPKGFFGGMSWSHPLGLEPQNGRDIFSEIVYGGRISLLIAFLATLLSVAIGSAMGLLAGYFGGWVDTVISRAMDVFLAFPLVVFALALVGVIPDHAFGLGGLGLRIALLIFIIGFFNWPYIGRVIRGQALSLREREFVDAARSLGARGPYIIVKEMLPNLVAPILIYATLLIPTNILFEAGLSFLGVGIQRQVTGEPGVSWGGMLSVAVKYYTLPYFMLWPGLAIFITVLAFNLFGDGLRDALDPKSK
jgi:ABC-type dipeptide/oligopeptide/nickel transport system permease subunit